MPRRQSNIILYSVFVVAGLVTLFFVIPAQVKTKANASVGPDMFPKMVTIIFILLSLFNAVSEYRNMKAEGESFAGYRIHIRQYLPHAMFLLSGIVFLIAAPVLGFVVAAVPFLLFLLFFFGSKNKVLNIIVAIVYPLALFALFSGVLRISFPTGMFGI